MSPESASLERTERKPFRRRRRTTAVLLFLALVGYSLFFLFGVKNQLREETPYLSSSDQRNPGASDRDEHETKMSQRENDSESLSPEFQRLREKWLDLDSKILNASDNLELSKESAAILGCSAEAIKLIELLHKYNIYNTIGPEVSMLLKTGVSAEQIENLIALPDEKSSDGNNYRESWIYAGAQSMDQDQAEAFARKIDCESCRQQFHLGLAAALAENNPELSVTRVIEATLEGGESGDPNTGLMEVISRLDSGAPFEKIGADLVAASTSENGSPISGSMGHFLGRWAETAPDQAANFLIKNQEHLDPSLIRPVAIAALRGDPRSGFDWIQNLPDGPHFDRAAAIAVDYLRGSHPELALEMAGLVGDPEIRARLQARAKQPLQEAGGN